jgi:hypothetical protein
MLEGKAPSRPTELADQLGLIRAQKASQGHVHYSFRALRRDAQNVAGALRRDLYASPTVAPASPWLGGEAPATPAGQFVGDGDSRRVTWAKIDGARFVAVQVMDGGGWRTHRIVGAEVGGCALPAGATAVALTAVGRTGLAGPAVVLPLR